MSGLLEDPDENVMAAGKALLRLLVDGDMHRLPCRQIHILHGEQKLRLGLCLTDVGREL